MQSPTTQPALFLAPEEMEFLTGYKLPTHQTKWLSVKGWRFELNANRRPIVARKYAEKMLGCGGEEQQMVPRPNFNALRAA